MNKVWDRQTIFENETPFKIRDQVAWKGATIATRLKFITDEMFVPTAQFLRAIKAIRSHTYRCILENRGYILFIRAPSGGGKTTLARFMTRLYPACHFDDRSERPIISLRVPRVITTKGMSEAVLEALGEENVRAGNQGDVMKRVLNLLEKADTVTTFLDNIQDIPEKRSAGGIREMGTWLRDYADDSRRLLVLLGTSEATQVVNAHLQIRRRAPGRCDIDYFNLHTEDGLSHLKQFLADIDKRLPLAEPSILGSQKFLMPFAWSTGGIPDYIIRLTSSAVMFAVNAGREHLTLDDLGSAFDGLYMDAGTGLNPFRGEISRVISNPGEPLEILRAKSSGEKRE